MKVKAVVLLSVLLLAVGAFAAEKSLTLSSPTTINGTQLRPGDYKVSYTVNGSTADVQIKKDKQVVASATAQLLEQPKSESRDSVVVQTDNDGTSKLVELRFARQKTYFRFTSDGAAGGK